MTQRTTESWRSTPHSESAGRVARARTRISQADRKKNVKAMTHEQLATFLTFSSARCSQHNHVLHLLSADAGLRPSEACAVKWSDFDALGKTVRVERAARDTARVKEIETGEDREVDLSTDTGSRRATGTTSNRWKVSGRRRLH